MPPNVRCCRKRLVNAAVEHHLLNHHSARAELNQDGGLPRKDAKAVRAHPWPKSARRASKATRVFGDSMKRRLARHGRSTEAEHWEILRHALVGDVESSSTRWPRSLWNHRPRTSVSLVHGSKAVGRSAMTMRCDHCRAPLGPKVHRYWQMRYCSTACASAYQGRVETATAEKIRCLEYQHGDSRARASRRSGSRREAA